MRVDRDHPLYNKCMGTFLQTKKGQELLRNHMQQLIPAFHISIKGKEPRIKDLEFTEEIIIHEFDI